MVVSFRKAMMVMVMVMDLRGSGDPWAADRKTNQQPSTTDHYREA